jgi:hypothetical protein
VEFRWTKAVKIAIFVQFEGLEVGLNGVNPCLTSSIKSSIIIEPTLYSMLSTLFSYIKDFLHDSKNVAFWCIWLSFLAIIFTLRYGLKVDIYFTGIPFGFLFKALIYPLLLATVIGFLRLTKLNTTTLTSSFWWTFLGLTVILTFNHYFNFFQANLFDAPLSTHYFYNKVLFNLHAIFWYFIPGLVWFKLTKKTTERIISFRFDIKVIAPYIFLLLILMPFIYWISFDAQFLISYPRYKPGIIETYYNWPLWATVGSFEISYALQFIGVEWFFRGFLLMMLGRYFGIHSIFIMVTAYGFLHFGKPFLEAVSSVFGGLLLGVFAWKSKNITGGIIIHLGIGLVMELFAFWNAR